MTHYASNYQAKRSATGSGVKKYLVVVFGLILIAVISGYIYQVTNISTKGFVIKDLEKQIAAVKIENQKMQVKLVEMQSSADLEGRVQELSMVPAGDIKYVQVAGTQVFVRK